MTHHTNLTNSSRCEMLHRDNWKSLIDPRFTASRFYRDPIYLGFVATIEYHAVDDDGVFQVDSASPVIIKDYELYSITSPDELADLVKSRIIEANEKLKEMVDD